MLLDLLLKSGVVLRLREGRREFWSTDDNYDDFCSSDNSCKVPIVDVAFVDDECLMLAANTPSILDANIDALLMSLTSVFKLLMFEINWKPGKTECCFVYRGGHAIDHYPGRRVGADVH